MTTTPYITISGTSYDLESLNDRCKLLAGDLVRTVQEYQAIMASYRQSLTLTNTYSGGLKDQIEKAELPQVFPYDDEKPTIKVNDLTYDASEMPDEVKAYVAELVRANSQKTTLEFRLRQLDAARTAFIKAIQDEIAESQAAPMDPQPELEQAA
jgi:hypothetical protein